MVRLLAISIICLFVSGCAFQGPMSSDELRTQDIGQPPLEYKKIITDWIGTQLKDPYSAHLDIGGDPTAGKMLTDNGYVYGWMYIVSVNARNSFGGYTGEEEWDVLINHDQVVMYSHSSPSH
jgi:hypothetical protein